MQATLIKHGRGFVYEYGDSSVGLIGDAWMHESCPAWAASVVEHPDEPGEVLEQPLATIRIDSGLVQYWWLLTCIDCAQQVMVFRLDWCPVAICAGCKQPTDEIEAVTCDGCKQPVCGGCVERCLGGQFLGCRSCHSGSCSTADCWSET